MSPPVVRRYLYVLFTGYITSIVRVFLTKFRFDSSDFDKGYSTRIFFSVFLPKFCFHSFIAHFLTHAIKHVVLEFFLSLKFLLREFSRRFSTRDIVDVVLGLPAHIFVSVFFLHVLHTSNSAHTFIIFLPKCCFSSFLRVFNMSYKTCTFTIFPPKILFRCSPTHFRHDYITLNFRAFPARILVSIVFRRILHGVWHKFI